jgi:hypothetical protein
MDRRTEPHPTLPPVRLRDYAHWLALAALALTLVFAAQQAVRRRAAGAPPAWGPALALNGLDWVAWGLLVPAIVAVGQRARIGGPGGRAAAAAVAVVWGALGVVCVVAAGVLTGLAIRLSPALFFGPGGVPPGPPPPLGRYLVGWTTSNSGFNTLIFGVIAGVLHAALYFRDLQARRLRQSELETRLTRAELAVLRMQLQPHFLFNALHTVSSLMVTDVAAAQGVVAALGTLLRASIDHTARQEIPLGDELAFVRLYLTVQHARFRHRLTVHVDAEESLLGALVPSLVLQPLVENAVRHGVEPSPAGGTVRIEARRAGERGERLVLRVRDEPAAPPAGRSPNGSGGVGLANVEARLAQLYGPPPACVFRAGRDAAGGFAVTLDIPYHVEEGLFPAALPGSAP